MSDGKSNKNGVNLVYGDIVKFYDDYNNVFCNAIFLDYKFNDESFGDSQGWWAIINDNGHNTFIRPRRLSKVASLPDYEEEPC